MKIILKNASRKFGAQTVFQNLSKTFEPGSRVAVLGGNGSGKSTLLKVLYGALSLSEGEIEHFSQEQLLSHFAAAHRASFAGPYFELIEELRAEEFLRFYGGFKVFRNDISPTQILEKALLQEAAGKQIQNFSSGMKQRLKLALALFSHTEVVFLDEPISNLDPHGARWFQNLLERELGNRSLFVGSNFNETEVFLCEEKLELKDF